MWALQRAWKHPEAGKPTLITSKKELDAFLQTKHIPVTNFDFCFDFFYYLFILIHFLILILFSL